MTQNFKTLVVKHAIITPMCRSNRGDLGAFEEAVNRLRDEYMHGLSRHVKNPFIKNFHLKLELEFEENEANHD